MKTPHGMGKAGALRRAAELILLFGGAPLLILYFKERALMVALLWAGAAVIYAWLRYAQGVKFAEEWNMAGFRAHVRPMLLRFAVAAPLMLLFMAVLHADRLFSFPLERPGRWALVMLLYPVLSVVPQEMIYKTLFFRRYGALFGDGRVLLFVSALAFGYMHILLGNPAAMAMTALAGLLMSQTYMRSRSLALVSLEHALYGCWAFTLGMGLYLYTGAAWAAR